MPAPTKTQTSKAVTAAGWKALKNHTVTCPSSAVVVIKIPDLPELVKAGQIPNDLVETAIGVASGRKVTRDDVIQQADFYNKLAALTVVEPVVTEENFANGDIPFEDKEFLVEIATRQRDLDAVGHHLGGLEKSRDFRTFRGIIGSYEDVEEP